MKSFHELLMLNVAQCGGEEGRWGGGEEGVSQLLIYAKSDPLTKHYVAFLAQ